MFGGLIRDPGLADEAAPLRAMLQIISRERVGIRACRVVATSADGLDHRSVACLLPRLVRSGHVDKVKRGRHSLHRLSADGRRLLDWLDAHSGDGGGTACRSLA
jgi:predicted transcriptional regulator of viral defense system